MSTKFDETVIAPEMKTALSWKFLIGCKSVEKYNLKKKTNNQSYLPLPEVQVSLKRPRPSCQTLLFPQKHLHNQHRSNRLLSRILLPF